MCLLSPGVVGPVGVTKILGPLLGAWSLQPRHRTCYSLLEALLGKHFHTVLGRHGWRTEGPGFLWDAG